jgi:hypothetical protein
MHHSPSPPRPLAVGLALLAIAALLAVTPAARLDAQQAAPRPSDPAADRDAVRRAALDYIEGFYEGDSTKHVRSLRPEFYKYGFYFNPDSRAYQGMQMTWPAAMEYSRRIRKNNAQAPATAPKEVRIFEVSDQTASVRVTAFWGIDYLLLGKYDGRWMISHVLWQSPPPTP